MGLGQQRLRGPQLVAVQCSYREGKESIGGSDGVGLLLLLCCGPVVAGVPPPSACVQWRLVTGEATMNDVEPLLPASESDDVCCSQDSSSRVGATKGTGPTT